MARYCKRPGCGHDLADHYQPAGTVGYRCKHDNCVLPESETGWGHPEWY